MSRGIYICAQLIVVFVAGLCVKALGSPVVINEIHFDPDVKTDLNEFIELCNPGPEDIDLTGWGLSGGVSFSFGDQTILKAYGYLVVVQNPSLVLRFESSGRVITTVPESLFGPFMGRLSNEGETIRLHDAQGRVVDEVSYKLGFPWPTVGDPDESGMAGTGCSIQLINEQADNDLAGSWRSAFPTPGTKNTRVFYDNTPPLIRQVKHVPEQPVSGQPVTITAKVTDADGIGYAFLRYQIVEPGQYISLKDNRYSAQWEMVTMNDAGLDGDAQAGDHTYTVRLPADLQQHRRLIRYRITIGDTDARLVTVPHPDDPQPNFAYFVYNGVPAWKGAIQPGSDEPVTFDSGIMNSVPVYHLISKQSDIETCTWRERYTGSEYKWQGTLVYNGHVYDHIRYRARGGVWRYAMGKNMWKFDFNRGHHFRARDNYGRAYTTRWDTLNLSACIQQGNYLHRGEQGLFEAASFKLFNLMGCEAPHTHWLQMRIIDDAQESGPTQYAGDFWGLYLALEQMDGKFLDEHNLPDGNLYKIEGYQGDLNNKGPYGPTNRSDINAFTSSFSSRPAEQWWRDNVDLERYYGYRCALEGVHHGDVGYGKNYFFYFNPETHLVSQLPWDVDLTWADNMYGNGEDPFKGRGAIFSQPGLLLEYNNRLREFHDLLYNADQMHQVLDEMAAIIDDPNGGPAIVDADRAFWDYHPIMADSSGYVRSGKGGQGRFYQRSSTKDFPGMVKLMKDYVVSGNREFDTYREDHDIPRTPSIRYIGDSDYAINDLVFETSEYTDPQGDHSFAALKWRIAEVEPWSAPVLVNSAAGPVETLLVAAEQSWRFFDAQLTRVPPTLSGGIAVYGQPWQYEIQPLWQSPTSNRFTKGAVMPASLVEPGHTYRVRCAMQDNTGRWSHWSSPIQFTASEAIDSPTTHALVITEIMYNPAPPGQGDPTDNDEFEFVEVQNNGFEIIDLSSVSFTRGIQFAFATGAIKTLKPGEFVLVVKNETAFVTRYGQALLPRIAGTYNGRLANGGETVILMDFWSGALAEFKYNDNWYNLTDGSGFSLVPAGMTQTDPDAMSQRSAWKASGQVGGSPGTAED